MRAVGFVSDGELRAFTNTRSRWCSRPIYEGFGLPPLEAMTCGCPVIISEQPALMEVCGDAALTCQADDADAIMRHMRALAADPALRERLAKAGRARAKRFTWESAARALLDYCLALGAKEGRLR